MLYWTQPVYLGRVCLLFLKNDIYSEKERKIFEFFFLKYKEHKKILNLENKLSFLKMPK